MNAETLIGTELGTCTLQKLIGQGGMGAVFLAQQSRPRRQVAIKVLLPTIPQAPQQQAAFLERFRRETDAAASLEHPNILPVHGYGEQGGLAYLIMPYVHGGTLRDELERERSMPLVQAMNYLDQIATALDVAHGRGVIHRDVKPANILKTAEGRLLLTDFGLVKIVGEGTPSQARLTGIGIPIGTPDYMAPEQVMGVEIDHRADLYSLGIILYQMVTGTVPFKGDLAMQIAMQHLHMLPQSPRDLRPDLPLAAEQVILRALEKQPQDRYLRGQDLANAFRQALTEAGVQLGDGLPRQPRSGNPTEEQPAFTRRSLFDPVWQPDKTPSLDDGSNKAAWAGMPPTTLNRPLSSRSNDIVAKNSMTLPSFSGLVPPMLTSAPISMAIDQPPMQQTSLPSSAKTGLLSSAKKSTLFSHPPTTPENPFDATPPSTPSPEVSEQPTMGTARIDSAFPTYSPSTTRIPNSTTQALSGTTMALTIQNSESGATSTMKLTQNMKVVKVPVAGQPGQYMTGLLPVLPAEPEPAPSPYAEKIASMNVTVKKNMRIVVLVAAVLLVIFGSSIFWLAHALGGQTASKGVTFVATPNVSATAMAQVSATAQANTILTDSLNENVHNWPISTSGSQTYVFKDGLYHIANNDTAHPALALLPDETLPGSLVYNMSIEEIKGDDSSVYNLFGMILRYTIHQKNGKNVITFYCFEISNTQGGTYQFRKYDDSFGADVSPWSRLWSKPFGHEYHYGHGNANKNMISVSMKGGKFAFTINGKQVGTVQDNALANGQIGMLVSLKGTEVAFSNLALTYH